MSKANTISSLGVGEEAPLVQKYPARQLPVGTLSPALSQYMPAGQTVQFSSLTYWMSGPYVPAGQG